MIKQTSKYSNFWLIFGQHTSEKYFVEFEIDPQQDVSLVAAKICKKALREAKVFSKIDANANKSFVLLNLRAINGRMTERYVAVVGIDQIDDEMITMENSIKKLLGNQSMNKIMENTASQNLQQFHLSKEDDAQRQNFLDIKAPEEVPKPSDELDYDEWVAHNETIWCQPK